MLSNIRKYSFSERAGFSRGYAPNKSIKEILLNNIPNAINVTESNIKDDKSGTDYWVERNELPPLSIDIKTRDTDPLNFRKPSDDLALETFSNIENQTIGWTRDKTKRTDYILWYFVPTSRWVLVPFPMLCQVFIEKWEEWKNKYQVNQQESSNGHIWHSECVFVPRLVVWREIYNKYGGVKV